MVDKAKHALSVLRSATCGFMVGARLQKAPGFLADEPFFNLIPEEKDVSFWTRTNSPGLDISEI